MNEANSILKEVRSALGLGDDVSDFDTELIIHINSALITLAQNGCVLPLTISDESMTWADIKDPTQVVGNFNFGLVPSYVTLSTKLIFDPPPPSAVEHFSKAIDQLLWRLKVSYEVFTTTTQRGDFYEA